MDSDHRISQRPGINGHRNRSQEASDPSHDRQSNFSAKLVAHTLTACVRCRKRKTRCDAGLPRCSPCERSSETCEYFDTTKGTKVNRTYVIHLQNKIQELEVELARIETEDRSRPDHERMARSAGLVRFKENDESRYLGPSSGIAITRLVMELAKRNTHSESIKDIVPDAKARQIKERFTKESSKPTSKVYPLISDVAAPELPSRELTESLIDSFNKTAQYNLPTLHEPSFRRAVENVYNKSTDAYENFTLRMVIAISMQKLDKQYAGLADSYYLAALPFLENAIRPMNLETLQCFALVAQYSLLTPTRTASYWVVGLAARLCQELGITEEATITQVDSKSKFNAVEIDMRRRLFWVITSMEFGLAHSLGRPSSFGVGPDHVHVDFFEAVDDLYITPSGVLPGSPQSPKKLIAIHFFKMRLLQAEIRFQLYLKKRLEPKNDSDPWFVVMDKKLKDWRASVPQNDEGSGFSEVWFEGRLNTMLVFLYRPSPQIPNPSVRAANICYKASIYNIQMQKDQIDRKSIDLTWIFTQSLFMALNAVLWALSYREIREEHPLEEVEKYLIMAREGISSASERWPGVESALELYKYLTDACLKAYDAGRGQLCALSSPSNRPSPASSQDVTTPPPISSPSTVISSISNDFNANNSSPFGYPTDYDYHYDNRTSISPALSVQGNNDAHQPHSFPAVLPQQPSFHFTTPYDDHTFDPASFYNPFPSTFPSLQHWSTPGSTTSGEAYSLPLHDHEYYLGSIGDQYSQYLHTPYVAQQPVQSLSEEEQVRLMRNLESDGLHNNGHYLPRQLHDSQ